MAEIITPGTQSFFKLRKNRYFYVDKTKFIKEWWNNGVDVTLIMRPRRFGKTLMLDTVKTFFSPEFAGQSDLFEDLDVWKDEKFRNLQGTIPVIFLSFARFNNTEYTGIISRIKAALASIYSLFTPLIDLNAIPRAERNLFTSVDDSMTDERAQDSLHYLCKFLTIQHNVKPIILLDEYDTPLQNAWLNGYWDEIVAFMRGFFNATFKDNPWIERGLITGITRVAKESIFSDLNNLEVVSATTNRYTDCFGFTEQEVFAAMDEYGLTEKAEVKKWYDGFIFGEQREIYNPWSIIKFLSTKELDTYWADTSSNALVSDLLAHSDAGVKKQAEILLNGKSIVTKLDEQIVFSQLYNDDGAIWSLLMSSGYVKPLEVDRMTKQYKLKLTNLEAMIILENKISEWFRSLSTNDDNNFIQALLEDDLDVMNNLMTEIAEGSFSYFDIKETMKSDRRDTESFYHGFVLGLLINLKNRYNIVSNRESGFGRYDICMYPKDPVDHGIVIEFKSIKSKNEKNLSDTCANALKQIKEKDYINDLIVHNVAKRNIYVYGFAFQGKKVLICGGAEEKLDWYSILGNNKL